MLKLYAVQTKTEVFISTNPQNVGYGNSKLHEFLFDGVPARESFHKCWGIIDTIPSTMQIKKTGNLINHRYVIQNAELFPNLPSSYAFSDVHRWEDGDFITSPEFERVKSLYVETNDGREEILEEVDFELILLAEVDLVPDVVPFSYRVDDSVIKEDRVIYPFLSQITVPSLLISQTPCSLSSKDSFAIVRHFVKQNINLDVATITSDYDFCFEVHKKIELWKPEEYSVDVNALTRRKPRYETRYRKTRLTKIFEMTYSPKNYDGYTPIKGFEGVDRGDLDRNIQQYLDNLIWKINEPLKDCPHCKGMGVLLEG